MRTFKYVIISEVYPHIFSEATDHADYREMNVTSAGMGKLFIDENGKLQVETFGKSVSLGGIKPKDGDNGILLRLFIDPYWN